jgi:hypothetical protein
MAEHDATAPTSDSGTTRGPVSEPSWKLADIYRAVKRSMAPLLALQASIEKQHRDVDDAFGRPMRRITQDVVGDATEDELVAFSKSEAVTPTAACEHSNDSVNCPQDQNAEQVVHPAPQKSHLQVKSGLAAAAPPEPSDAQRAPPEGGRGRRGRRKRGAEIDTEEMLLVVYNRDQKAALLSARELEKRLAKEFGNGTPVVSYKTIQNTVLYRDWRSGLSDVSAKFGSGWSTEDILEQGLEIHGYKPGRSDKRQDWDHKNDAAIKAFLRATGNAEVEAKRRKQDSGKARGK